MRRTPSMRAPTVCAALACAAMTLAGSALAQSGPPIGTMPMPPSASDAPPRDAGATKKQPKKAAQQRKKPTEDGSGADGSIPAAKPRARGANNAGTGQSYERPNRYVPEEFDRGGGDGRAKPFMSESGRPGMGMRF